ncbi:hypothetical protein [Solibacillus sp.]
MLKFIDDLAGAVFDVLKLVSYFIAGVILVAIPLILIAKLFEWLF